MEEAWTTETRWASSQVAVQAMTREDDRLIRCKRSVLFVGLVMLFGVDLAVLDGVGLLVAPVLEESAKREVTGFRIHFPGRWRTVWDWNARETWIIKTNRRNGFILIFDFKKQCLVDQVEK